MVISKMMVYGVGTLPTDVVSEEKQVVVWPPPLQDVEKVEVLPVHVADNHHLVSYGVGTGTRQQDNGNEITENTSRFIDDGGWFFRPWLYFGLGAICYRRLSYILGNWWMVGSVAWGNSLP